MKRIKPTNKTSRVVLGIGLLLVVLMVGVSPAVAQSFGLTRSAAVGGGGTVQTAGGAYSVNGSIGQPVATSLTDAGGQYSLTGGIQRGSSGPGGGEGPRQQIFLPLIVQE